MRQHTMRGVAYRADRTVEVIDYPMPTLGPGQALIEIKAAAICGSDLHTYRRPQSAFEGRPAWIPGHEPTGVVAEVGATGRVTGAHLDWRMNLRDRRIDPELLVPPMPSGERSAGR